MRACSWRISLADEGVIPLVDLLRSCLGARGHDGEAVDVEGTNLPPKWTLQVVVDWPASIPCLRLAIRSRTRRRRNSLVSVRILMANRDRHGAGVVVLVQHDRLFAVQRSVATSRTRTRLVANGHRLDIQPIVHYPTNDVLPRLPCTV